MSLHAHWPPWVLCLNALILFSISGLMVFLVVTWSHHWVVWLSCAITGASTLIVGYRSLRDAFPQRLGEAGDQPRDRFFLLIMFLSVLFVLVWDAFVEDVDPPPTHRSHP